MLRPSLIFTTGMQQCISALQSFAYTHMTKPRTTARYLALFIVPTTAVAWWYYSVAMSVAGMAPLQTVETNSKSSFIEPQILPELLEREAASHSVDTSTVIQTEAGETNVTINGQNVPVPSEGTTQGVIEHDDGQTKVNISVESETSGSSESESSSSFHLNSSTSVTSESTYTLEEKTH